MSKKLYDLVARVLNVPANSINDESGPTSIENWSSFKGYVLLYEAMDVKKVADIKRHLANHGITL
ncbi:MAG: acyl carrier protein [Nitrososphaeria archaeon]|nr:acyl carrier protein [Nitrososphaeria archaeon]